MSVEARELVDAVDATTRLGGDCGAMKNQLLEILKTRLKLAGYYQLGVYHGTFGMTIKARTELRYATTLKEILEGMGFTVDNASVRSSQFRGWVTYLADIEGSPLLPGEWAL